MDAGSNIVRTSRSKTGKIIKNKLFAVFCDMCASFVAYRPKTSKLAHTCASCRAKSRLSDPTKNPMYGKIQKNKERFRKKTLDNVDYEDRIVEYTSSGNKRIKYKQNCPVCGDSVGYRSHSDAHRKCVPCQAIKNTKRSKIQAQLKASMKASIVARLRSRRLNKNKKSTFDAVGYSVDDLISHLESKWQPGMTWDNYGLKGWHIDHVRPDSWFSYSSVEDSGFVESWSLNNLQPMWAKDNLSKSNKYEG